MNATRRIGLAAVLLCLPAGATVADTRFTAPLRELKISDGRTPASGGERAGDSP